MKKKHKKLSALLSLSLAFSLVAAGCGKEKIQDTGEMSGESDTLMESGSSTDADSVEITAGSYEGEAVYINESFGFKMTLVSDKWSFKTAEEIAAGTGENVSDIEGVLNGEISPFTRSISYLAIACNNDTGSNVIISYMCPALNQLDTYLTAEEYIAKAAEGYDGAKTGKQDLAGESWDYLERTDLAEADQKILARSMDGIIVMITFTVVDDEDCEGMFE